MGNPIGASKSYGETFDTKVNGLYTMTDRASGTKPDGENGYGELIVLSSIFYGLQIFYSVNTKKFWVRDYNENGPISNKWVELSISRTYTANTEIEAIKARLTDMESKV